MKKVIDFCKEKYKILIPIVVVFVLLIAVYFLYREYRYDNYRNKQEESVFQYFGGIKNEYTAIVTYNLKNVIVNVEGKDKRIEYDATPIYYSEENKIIFPSEMSIVFPLKDGNQYKLYKYSVYEYGDVSKITSGTLSDAYNHFFMYDGHGLFFFSEDVVLKINGDEYKKLSANSYAEVVGGYTLSYYDKESDTAEVIETEGKKVTISNDNLDLNLNERYFMVFNEKILLANPYNLNALLSN